MSRFPILCEAPFRDALKVMALAISMIAIVGSLSACGKSDTKAAEKVVHDRVVPRLPNGLSIDEVKERLGEPRTQFEVEETEVAMIYGPWQVVFDPNLYKRTRYYVAGDWPADRPVTSLDRKVKELSLGNTRAVIERKLGKTEAWQILDFKKRERIWYGNGRWKLSLRNGRLAGKENTQQATGANAPKRVP